jgi:glyoxylase-like metal-dependent hydrolase (beta-lactamase superfamily II)
MPAILQGAIRRMMIPPRGPIINGLYMLGPAAMPVYLLDGKRPALFDAGLAFLGRLYVHAVQEILGTRPPQFCFLTHSHFDHCGSVSIFKTYFPFLKVASSARTKNIVGRPNAVALIRELTQATEQLAHSIGTDLVEFDRFEPFEVDITLKDGDAIELSDQLTVQVLETPGHTWDCLSYYIPQEKVLLLSEAAGIPDQSGYIVSDCLVDYDRYYESLTRLSRLEVKVICLGHLRVFTGKDAESYLYDSLKSCQKFLHQAETFLRQADGDVQKAMQQIKKVEYDDRDGPKQIEAAYLLNLEARIQAIKRRMQN